MKNNMFTACVKFFKQNLRWRSLMGAMFCPIVNLGLVFVVSVVISMPTYAAEKILPKCLYVASYHKGYDAQDGIERGLRSVLEGKCEIKQFNMDTKRNAEPDFIRQKALEAKALIESWKPDVVIASDDNASKFLVAPYYKDAELPFVFCGINWTGEEYGYPYSNATGMIEIPAVVALIKQVKRIVPDATTATCLCANRIAEIKYCNFYKQSFHTAGIEVNIITVDDMDGFEQQYLLAQNSDLIIFLNYVGINEWDETRAKRIVLNHSSTLTTGANIWDIPYIMLLFTLVYEEHGEYAAEAALQILEGTQPGDIPVIANRKWNLYVNERLLEAAGIKIPSDLLQKAEKVD